MDVNKRAVLDRTLTAGSVSQEVHAHDSCSGDSFLLYGQLKDDETSDIIHISALTNSGHVAFLVCRIRTLLRQLQ
jgi:hypothetical protein